MFEPGPKEVIEQSHMDMCGKSSLGRAVSAKGTASAKALGVEFAWCIQATAKKLW